MCRCRVPPWDAAVPAEERTKERTENVRSAAFHTLGCKVNIYETEAMQQALLRAGYEIRSFEEPADVYVINTCSVTNIADKKSRQMLHRARSLNPGAVIVAAGCYAQAAAGELAKDTGVDIILGNQEKKDIARVLERWFRGDADDEGEAARTTEKEAERKRFAAAGDIAAVRRYDDLPAFTMSGHTRAFLKIQDGCNQFCSYCIIPYLRGRIRSRKPEDILTEAKAFADQGFRELVLTGINLSSYGMDFDGAGAEKTEAGGEAAPDLAAVIQLLDDIPGIQRVRAGSLEPRLITRGFLETLAGTKHFCPHFHLSLQSGSDSVLKRMNRHYTAEEYYRSVCLLREYFPDAAVTTDIITGFPGETEEEFAETLAFAEKVGFYEIHVFPYSVRKGTRAASMPGQLTRAVKAERAGRLSALNALQARAFREKRMGTVQEILTEEEVTIGGIPYVVGNTKEYVRIAAPAGTPVNTLYQGEAVRFLADDLLLFDSHFREGT